MMKRVQLLRDLGSKWKAGAVQEVPDDVALLLLDAGLVGELPDPAPGGVQSSEILTPDAGGGAGEADPGLPAG